MYVVYCGQTVGRINCLSVCPLALSQKNHMYTDFTTFSVKAKFHYAIWFEAIVRSRLEAGRGPVADLLARASSLQAS